MSQALPGTPERRHNLSPRREPWVVSFLDGSAPAGAAQAGDVFRPDGAGTRGRRTFHGLAPEAEVVTPLPRLKSDALRAAIWTAVMAKEAKEGCLRHK